MKNGTTFLSPVPFRLGKLFFPNIAGETGTPHWSFNFEPLPLFDDFKYFYIYDAARNITFLRQRSSNKKKKIVSVVD